MQHACVIESAGYMFETVAASSCVSATVLYVFEGNINLMRVSAAEPLLAILLVCCLFSPSCISVACMNCFESKEAES